MLANTQGGRGKNKDGQKFELKKSNIKIEEDASGLPKVR